MRWIPNELATEVIGIKIKIGEAGIADGLGIGQLSYAEQAVLLVRGR